jgi:hypothetical protein
MTLADGLPPAERSQAQAAAQRILFLMAVLATILGGIYLLGLIGKLIVDGSVHSVSSPGIQLLSAVIAILWDLSLLVLFAALRWQITGKGMIFAELAFVFMILVCAASSTSWFVQLSVIPRLGEGANPALQALLDIHQGLSLTYAMEHLGWGLFYGLAAICLAAALQGGRLENWLRGLLAVGGSLSLLHLVGVIVDNAWLTDLGYIAWGVLLPATTLLLAVRYKPGASASRQ